MQTTFHIKPAGGKRSSKREQILNVFLNQEGHLSAEELVARIQREDRRVSRATVYRTLQWMVDAGIASKVDFGDGLARYERSYRHPRHYHLICNKCHRSFEFLSSDVESLVEEVAAASGFEPLQTVVQVYGTCEDCRAGRQETKDPGHKDLLFARDALRIAIATERSGLEFYTRAFGAREVYRLTEPGGRIVEANDYYLRVIGKDAKGRIVNKTIGTVFTGHADAYAKECPLK